MKNPEIRNYQIDRDEFVSRLRDAVGGSVTAVADLTGIKVTTLHGWLRDTKPPFEGIVAISNATGVSLDWLANGGGPKRLEGVDTSGMVRIPHLDVQASAGPGLVPQNEDQIGELGFDSRWLRDLGITSPANARVITANGTSNEPLIRHGDMLLVDTGVKTIGDTKFYVILHNGDLRVKECSKRIDGAITIRSHNKEFDDREEIAKSEADQVEVCGLVRWYGRAIG